MAQAMFIATCLWKLIIALISTPSDCVLLLLCRMAQAMSIATCLWKLITTLNSTPSACAAAASKCSQDHPLLRRSQQMLSNPDVDTTPPVAHCAGPINCCFYCIARFTIKTIPESCSRTSTTSSQDAKVDLKPLIVSEIPIYGLSDTINLFCVLFFILLNKLITFSAS